MDFSAIAHDLRTPLTVMLGHMHLLAAEALSDSGRQRLVVLEAQIRRMMRVLESCEQDSEATRLVPTDIIRLLTDATSEFHTVLEGRGIGLTSDIPPALPLVLGDADLLHRVLVNLLVNAAESIQGDGRIAVRARVRRNGNPHRSTIDIDVTDTGAGIASNLIPRVFDRGFTTKESREPRGIGLSICREILHLHGGDITLSSEPGAGTTVRVSLPAHS
jgi:signal transduction histidine kinase